MMGKIKKYANIFFAIIILSVFSVPFIDTSTNKFPYDCAILPVNSSSEVTSVIIDKDKTYIVGDFLNSAAVKNTLKHHSIAKVDSLIIYSLNDYVAGQIVKIKSSIKIGSILCPAQGIVSGLDLLIKNDIENFYVIDNNLPDVFELMVINERALGYTYKTELTNVLFLSYNADFKKISFEQINSVSTIRCFAYFGAFSDRIYITNMPKGYFADDAYRELSLNEFPNMIYLPKNGSIANFQLN